MTNAALAETVGLSQSACLRRLRLLERSGVLRGYTAIIDEPAERATVTVIVQITLDRQTEEHLSRFETAVRRLPEVRECYLMTGMSDTRMRAGSCSTRMSAVERASSCLRMSATGCGSPVPML